MSERDYQAERRAEEKRRQGELATVTQFHDFLQGKIPKGVTVKKFRKMTPDQAFSVIWFLQEVSHLLSDRFEMCDNCKVIYDSHSEGRYDDDKGRCYCDSCDPEE